MLFIPLKAEYYYAFLNGTKTWEYRVYDSRWNFQTCRPGRRVELSCGYGAHDRAAGWLVDVMPILHPQNMPAWRACYGPEPRLGIALKIDLIARMATYSGLQRAPAFTGSRLPLHSMNPLRQYR